MALRSPGDFARNYIFRWEDGKQSDPNKTHSLRTDDAQNYTGGRIGVGALVGSNHGTGSIALATYRGVPVASITREVMHALTIDEAAAIALRLYYDDPNLDLLPWSALMASVMDFGWGAGPMAAGCSGRPCTARSRCGRRPGCWPSARSCWGPRPTTASRTRRPRAGLQYSARYERRGM